MPKTANVVVGASTLLLIAAATGRGMPDSKMTDGVIHASSATLVERVVASNNEGICEVPTLPSGVYRMRVKAAGFQLYLVEALTTTSGLGRITTTRFPTGGSGASRPMQCGARLRFR